MQILALLNNRTKSPHFGYKFAPNCLKKWRDDIPQIRARMSNIELAEY